MKIKQTQPKIKAMAFGGCSFTWGQGLHYYSALDSLIPDTDYGYNEGNHSVVHHLFREKWRWPTQVAEHFGTVALTHHENGGSNDLILKYWNESFKKPTQVMIPAFNKLKKSTYTRPIKYSDVSHFVFQFTHWMRTRYVVPVNGEDRIMDTYESGDVKRPEVMSAFMDYVAGLDIAADSNNNKVGTFHQNIIKKDVNDVKLFLQGLEEQGIKTYVLAWPFEHVELVKKDEWLGSRFIQLEYNERKFDCIEEMQRDNPGLYIENDFDFFEQAPVDKHPSLKCHKIIADNVIRFIKEQNG